MGGLGLRCRAPFSDAGIPRIRATDPYPPMDACRTFRGKVSMAQETASAKASSEWDRLTLDVDDGRKAKKKAAKWLDFPRNHKKQ